MTIYGRRLGIAAACLLFSTLVATGPGAAKDLNGKVGLGLVQSISGITALSVRYWPLAKLGITATVGVDLIYALEDPANNSPPYGVQIQGSVGFLYNLAQSEHANLGTGLRLSFTQSIENYDALSEGAPEASSGPARAGATDPGDTQDDDIGEEDEGLDLPGFAIEIPLVAEFFLSDNFSISVATGISILFDNDLRADSAQETGDPIKGFQIGVGTAGISGTLTILYCF